MSTPVKEILSRIDKITDEERKELERKLAVRPADRPQEVTRGNWKKKLIMFGILLGTAAIVFGSTFILESKEALARSDRKDEFGADISYRVEQYRYRNRALLSFSSGSNSSIFFHLSPLKIDKIVEQRWLANGRAIFLNLSVKPGSSDAPAPARVIYDFQRGEMHVASPVSLWRTDLSGNRWMNDAEFDGVLARFGQ